MDKILKIVTTVFLGAILVSQILILQRLSQPLEVKSSYFRPVEVEVVNTVDIDGAVEVWGSVDVSGSVEIDNTPLPVEIW